MGSDSREERFDVKTRVVGLVGLSAAFCLLVLAYGCDKGVEPGASSTSYEMYFFDIQGTADRPLFRYSYPERILDSFSFPIVPRELELSVDGERLYARNLHGGSVSVISTRTMQAIQELPWGEIALSPDGRMVAISGDDLWIFDTHDYSQVLHDSDAVSGGRFSDDSRRYWDQGGDYLYCVNLGRRGEVHRFVVGDGSTGQNPVMFTPDERSFFFLNTIGTYTDLFRHYDLGTDSVVYRGYVVPGKGDMAMSPSGDRVYIGSPGSLHSYPRVYSYAVYWPGELKCDSIQLGYDCGLTQPYLFDPAQFSISPDGQLLLGLSLFAGTAMLIEPSSNTPIDTICIGNPIWLRCPVIGMRRGWERRHL